MQLSETNETDKGRPYIYVMLAAFETSYVPHDPNCISPKKFIMSYDSGMISIHFGATQILWSWGSERYVDIYLR